MNPTQRFAGGVSLVAVLAACAHTPAPPDTRLAGFDCAGIEAQLDTAAQQRRAAAQQRQDAWKAVVPFAVMARYGQAQAAADASQQRLDELHRQAALRGCEIPTH